MPTDSTPKDINAWHLVWPFMQGLTGTYMGLMVPTLINEKAYLHARMLEWVKNKIALYIIMGVAILTVIVVQVYSIQLMVISLKKVGASVMVIVMYLSSFLWTNLADYLTIGTMPSKSQYLGMVLMIFGVMH
jgi:drug/metabolite transporter (DMT)-like permease